MPGGFQIKIAVKEGQSWPGGSWSSWRCRASSCAAHSARSPERRFAQGLPSWHGIGAATNVTDHPGSGLVRFLSYRGVAGEPAHK